jgi:VanZ family protein
MTIAAFLAVLVLLNMVMIFCFSAAGKEESGDMSSGFARIVMRLLYPGFDEISYMGQQNMLQGIHKLVRKAAHFCEFGLLGLLSTGLMLFVSRYLKRLRTWLTWVAPTVFTLLYAISDEVHQIFSDRGSRATDVLIDFAGALCGILLLHGLVWLLREWRMREEQSRRSFEREVPPCKIPDTD